MDVMAPTPRCTTRLVLKFVTRSSPSRSRPWDTCNGRMVPCPRRPVKGIEEGREPWARSQARRTVATTTSVDEDRVTDPTVIGVACDAPAGADAFTWMRTRNVIDSPLESAAVV